MRRLLLCTVLALVLSLLVPPVIATETDDTARLDRVEAWQGSATATQFENATDVRAAIDDGRLSRATGVNGTHTLVVELGIQGFDGAIAAANGSTVTDRFQAALSEHGDLTVRQTNMGPNQLPVVVDALNGTGVTVYPDRSTDTYYLAVNLTGGATYRGDSPTRLAADRRYQFDVDASLDADSPLTDDAQRAMTAIAPRESMLDTAPDGRVHLRPQANQTVTGTTNLGTGSQVTVVLAGEDDPDTSANESFLLTREVTVDAIADEYRYEGDVTATFDLREVSPAATNVTLDVRSAGQSLLDGPVVARVNGDSASVDAGDVREGGGSVGVTVSGSLAAGGFYVLRATTADGPVVGHSEYLDPGAQNVTVYVDRPVDADELVVVAHRDGNHNRWFDGPGADVPYSGSDATDTVAFDVPLSDDTPATPTDEPRTVTGTPSSPGPTPDDNPSGTASVGPGGAVPAIGLLTVVVLLGALLRRQS